MKSTKLIIVLIGIALFAWQCLDGVDEENECTTIPLIATPYDIVIPPFFPPMDIPADNPMTVEGIALGRLLFWEKALSLDHSISCGSCHEPDASFSDPDGDYDDGGSESTGSVAEMQPLDDVESAWAVASEYS